MKVAVVGNGKVGMAVFQSLLAMREVTRIALVGRNVDKIKGEVRDYQDYIALRPDCKTRLTGGDYSLTEGADIIIYTAGTPRKPDQSRLDLLKANIGVVKDIFTEINKYNKEAVVIAVSNPVDVITTVIQKITGRPRSKVIGTGTLLDTARLRRMVADFLDVSTDSVVFNVVGEHGNSSCLLWSSLRIAGLKLQEFIDSSIQEDFVVNKEKMHDVVASSGGKLIKSKGYTAYGAAAAACRIASAIIYDTREIMPVSTVLSGEYDVDGIAISVPCILGAKGAEVLTAGMSEEERQEFAKSADIIKEAYQSIIDQL